MSEATRSYNVHTAWHYEIIKIPCSNIYSWGKHSSWKSSLHHQYSWSQSSKLMRKNVYMSIKWRWKVRKSVNLIKKLAHWKTFSVSFQIIQRLTLKNDRQLELRNWGCSFYNGKLVVSKLLFIYEDILYQGLLVVYLVVVVVLVKRQIRVVDDDEDDEDYEDQNKDEVLIMTDKKGVTDAKNVDTILMDTNEIFLWSSWPRNRNPSYTISALP